MRPGDVLAPVRALLNARGLDAILVSSDTNRRYLTGFSATDGAPDESSGVVIVARDAVTLCVGPNEREWAESEAQAVPVVPWERPWTTFVARRLRQAGYARIGFEDRALTVAFQAGLAKAAPELTWSPLGSTLDAFRARKRPDEVAALERAIAATDQVYAAVLTEIRPGMSERAVSRMIERLSRELGGGVAFEPIVASGPHAARPHHGVTDRAIEQGEPVIIDMGVSLDGYNGDLTRTFWLGEAPDRLRDVYNAVDRAHAAAMAAIRPGQTAKVIDQSARDALTAAGLGEAIVHSVGHGLGMRVHEAPSISIHSDDVIEAGHVFTVEPGAYFAGWGGVRIEDVVVVTEDRFRVLSAAPKMAG